MLAKYMHRTTCTNNNSWAIFAAFVDFVIFPNKMLRIHTGAIVAQMTRFLLGMLSEAPMISKNNLSYDKWKVGTKLVIVVQTTLVFHTH